MQLEYGPAEIALEVRDDGRGFAAQGETTAEPGHYGLTGMRERAAAIGGTLEVTSEAGRGNHGAPASAGAETRADRRTWDKKRFAYWLWRTITWCGRGWWRC